MTENRNGFVVESELRQVSGAVERETAKDMIVRYSPGAKRITVGADKGFDTADFVSDMRDFNVTPHVAQNTTNRLGKGFAILGIYLFVVCYYGMLNSTTWLYGAEVLPIALRSKIMGLAAASHFIVNVAITEAGPTSFARIHENYYYVFVACAFFFLIIAYFYFP